MLTNLREYHRPAKDAPNRALDYALELLARPEIRTVPLAGGDTLLASGDASIEAVVDLQGLGLERLDVDTNARALQAGAMATRAALAVAAPALSGKYTGSPVGLISEGARRWSGNVQRNRATLGGALAVAASNDPLMVALLVCDAYVEIRTVAGCRWLPLVQFIAGRKALLAEPALITQIRVPLPPEPVTGYALADVARTPSDAPIVVAAAAIAVNRGRCSAARLALGGVAPDPTRLPEVEALLEGKALAPDLLTEAGRAAAEAVQPAGDFRGSADYRRAMAGVLSTRALSDAWKRAA
jgi:CO/xanthine dehydrogenase FAD-binding subunit